MLHNPLACRHQHACSCGAPAMGWLRGAWWSEAPWARPAPAAAPAAGRAAAWAPPAAAAPAARVRGRAPSWQGRAPAPGWQGQTPGCPRRQSAAPPLQARGARAGLGVVLLVGWLAAVGTPPGCAPETPLPRTWEGGRRGHLAHSRGIGAVGQQGGACGHPRQVRPAVRVVEAARQLLGGAQLRLRQLRAASLRAATEKRRRVGVGGWQHALVVHAAGDASAQAPPTCSIRRRRCSSNTGLSLLRGRRESRREQPVGMSRPVASHRACAATCAQPLATATAAPQHLHI